MAEKRLTEQFEMNKQQTQAVLRMTLGSLSRVEKSKLEKEAKELDSEIKYLTDLSIDDKSIYRLMSDQIDIFCKKYLYPRLSKISDDSFKTDVTAMESLIINSEVTVILTAGGWLRRVSLDKFRSQHRNSIGKSAGNDDSDYIQCFLTCNVHDRLLAVTPEGLIFSVRVYDIGDTPRGTRLAKVYPRIDKVAALITVPPTAIADEFIVVMSEMGYIKKTLLSGTKNASRLRGLRVMSPRGGDAVKFVRIAHSDKDSVLVGTEGGYAIRCLLDDVRTVSRSSKGCKAISLRKGDRAVSMEVVSEERAADPNTSVFTITAKGVGKRNSLSSFKVLSRPSKGSKTIKLRKSTNDKLACMKEKLCE
eukprot:GHVL01020634.1.p1 GENE.GHVL01020634.1~~GHVL01020634.1.p1  ORF type:complete len:362 (-),score=71.50 GHVL01020634.1:617-1702(-)